jgi:hypothetical protein
VFVLNHEFKFVIKRILGEIKLINKGRDDWTKNFKEFNFISKSKKTIKLVIKYEVLSMIKRSMSFFVFYNVASIAVIVSISIMFISLMWVLYFIKSTRVKQTFIY